MSKKDVVCMFSGFGIPEDKIKEAVRTWIKVELVMRCANTEGAADAFCNDEKAEPERDMQKPRKISDEVRQYFNKVREEVEERTKVLE